MLATDSDGSRGSRGVCISLRRLGDEIELAFDAVRLESGNKDDRTWRHHHALHFAIMRSDEFDGNMSVDRLAAFGQSVLDVLFPLNRPENRNQT